MAPHNWIDDNQQLCIGFESVGQWQPVAVYIFLSFLPALIESQMYCKFSILWLSRGSGCSFFFLSAARARSIFEDSIWLLPIFDSQRTMRPKEYERTGIRVCHFQNVTNIMSIVYECALYLYQECGVKYSSIDIAAISKVEIERYSNEGSRKKTQATRAKGALRWRR